MTPVVVTLPLQTVSESNRRDFWAKRAARAKIHRQATVLALRQPVTAFREVLAAERQPTPARPARGKLAPAIAMTPVSQYRVAFTRISPRALDDDNLRGALKAVRDGVADALGIDDRDSRVTWSYGQERGKKGEYAVSIDVCETCPF